MTRNNPRTDQRPAFTPAFTLVELLVVIGIISILVAILLPALSKAKAQANQVYCASNLRQLYTAMQLYATSYNQYVMPAKIATGSDIQNMWCGINVLGPLYGVRSGTSGTAQAQALNRIARMLDCPAVDRPKDLATAGVANFTVDYTYNENLGSTKGQKFIGNGDYSNTYDPWLAFKRTTQVPQCALIALDGYDTGEAPFDKNDVRFIDLGDLTKDHRRAGWPHKQKANMLFNDGTVHTLNPWDKSVKLPYSLPLGDPGLKPNPELKNWLIFAPPLLKSPANTGGTKYKPEDVWQKGRELTF